MTKTIISWLSLSLLAITVAAACGKKDDKDKGDKGAPGGKDTPAESSSDAPDKATVAAMDCTKACTGQFDCAKKNGMLSASAKLSDCESACNTIKAIYDPVKQGAAVKQMLSYADGNCD